MTFNFGITIDLVMVLIFAAVAAAGVIPMRVLGLRRESGMFIALVALCFFLSSSNENFLKQSNAVNTTRQISMLGIYAIGIGFVIVTGGIDLSIGSVIGLTGVLIAKLSLPGMDDKGNVLANGGMGWSLWAAIPFALLVAMLIGLVQGLLISRLGLQPFIVTLGFMLTLRGISQTICQGGTLSLPDSPFRQFANRGLFMVDGDPLISYPMVIFIAVLLIGAYVLHFTVFGRYIFAIGGNRDAAEYSGINVKAVETSTYVISSFLGGVAGVCYASYVGQMSQQVGVAYELFAISAAVLGGISLRGGEGSVVGILIGAAVMKVIENGINMFQWKFRDVDGREVAWRLNQNWTSWIIGGVLLIAVILDQVFHIIQAKRRTRKPIPVAPTA